MGSAEGPEQAQTRLQGAMHCCHHCLCSMPFVTLQDTAAVPFRHCVTTSSKFCHHGFAAVVAERVPQSLASKHAIAAYVHLHAV